MRSGRRVAGRGRSRSPPPRVLAHLPVDGLRLGLPRQLKKRLDATRPQGVVVVELDDPVTGRRRHRGVPRAGRSDKPEPRRVVGPALARPEVEVADPGVGEFGDRGARSRSAPHRRPRSPRGSRESGRGSRGASGTSAPAGRGSRRSPNQRALLAPRPAVLLCLPTATNRRRLRGSSAASARSAPPRSARAHRDASSDASSSARIARRSVRIESRLAAEHVEPLLDPVDARVGAAQAARQRGPDPPGRPHRGE